MVDRDLIKELQVNQPLLGRQGYRLGPIGSAQLTHNGTDMEFDRPLTDDQVSGNLFVGEALGQEGQNLPFTGGKGFRLGLNLVLVADLAEEL